MSSTSKRVFRGGCWYSTASLCRSADRYWNEPGLRSNGLGFRPARLSVRLCYR